VFLLVSMLQGQAFTALMNVSSLTIAFFQDIRTAKESITCSGTKLA
jgi:hypothetical protein